jgi:hypothetical protein
MPSLFGRFFDAIASWNRRREEREREFVASNATWTSSAAAPRAGAPAVSRQIDREGLQAAFLDQSGRIAYFLDTASGEVVEQRDGAAMPPPQFRRVPSRPADADDADRRAFIDSLDASPARDRLAGARSAVEFRNALSEDHTLERRWYVFRNDRASAAVEEWLKGSE